MAIAPSKLGRLVFPLLEDDDALLIRLRALGLVRHDVSDQVLVAVFRKAREEHAAMSEGERLFNSPHERVRVFLEPYLSDKGSD